MNYKKEEFQSLITNWLLDDTFSEKQNDLTIVDEYDEENQEEYFDIELFEHLETSIERLRYFVLYRLKNVKDLNTIMTKIIIDLQTAIDHDAYVLIKTLLKLFQYDAEFIPSYKKINEILYESLQNDELTNDARQLIVLYFNSQGLMYSQEEIDNLIIFSIQNDNECRTSIWKLLIRFIMVNSYSLALENIMNMIDLFPELKTLDKYYVTHIMLAMFISDNEENNINIKTIFMKSEESMKDILFICAEGENITIISAILYYIKNLENFDKFEDLIIYCREKKINENLKILIVQDYLGC